MGERVIKRKTEKLEKKNSFLCRDAEMMSTF